LIIRRNWRLTPINHNKMSDQYYTINSAIYWAQNALKEANCSPTPMLDAEVLLIHALGITKEDIYFDPERVIAEKDYYKYEKLIARRKNSEPIAYITGEKEFFALPIKVNEDVLVPRPETEELVERALNFIKEYDGKSLAVLEIGTGSGAIAIALAKSLENWQEKYNFKAGKIKIIASDCSKKALKQAKKNAKANKVDKKIEFIESDLLDKIKKKDKDKIELVVTNLPYLDIEKRDRFPKDLSYEPGLALFCSEGGLELYNQLLEDIPNQLPNVKKVIVEVLDSQAGKLPDMGILDVVEV